MKTGAIICEYNPFHNGHKYHIEKTKKELSLTHLVAVMSGNFTQRGDVAILNKWDRAKIALENGIDLVIELPVAFSLGSAEHFAMGAVTLLNALECVDYLSFGSECGDVDLLSETAGAVQYCTTLDEFYFHMKRGNSYPAALQKTIEAYYTDDILATLATPNNTLAIEYLKAMSETGSMMKPFTVKRYGAEHDSDKGTENIISASNLREMLINRENTNNFTPNCYADKSFAQLKNIDTAILAKIRSMSEDEIKKAPNVLHGLENRIKKAARIARSFNELCALVKTKRYTMARIRRIILCLFLGITKKDILLLPQYIHVLGMNSKGKEILSNASLKSDTSLMNLIKSSPSSAAQGLLEERAGNLYALSFDKPLSCGIDFTHKPIIFD